MKGKKNDPIFVAQFIRESVQNGIDTPEKIVNLAKHKIASIDEEIKAIEDKKRMRSKLLDVINTFEKTIKNTSESATLLPFFRLEYPEMCKFICDLVKKNPIDIGEKSQALGLGENDPTMRFCIKQLLECKVLSRLENQVSCGERFDEYMKFVLHED